MMMITTTTIVTAKIREAAMAEEEHKSGKWGVMIHYTLSAFRQGNLKDFNAVEMHIYIKIYINKNKYKYIYLYIYISLSLSPT